MSEPATAPRRRLPNRRQSLGLTFIHEGVTWHAHVGFFADGRPAEVFLEGGRVGSPLQALTRNEDGAAAGPLGVLFAELAAALEEIAKEAAKQDQDETPGRREGRHG